jgi:uridine phosphorylase
MADFSKLPILNHPTDEPSAFTAPALIEDVRRLRQLRTEAAPPVCFLEFDGDLTDWLVEQGLARPFPSWPCFHTTMFMLELEGLACGIIPRTIGGPFAVLIAEQLHAFGTKVIVGLTSAGRVDPDLRLPGLVVATSAIRDEGTSYHYLPPAKEVVCPSKLPRLIGDELVVVGFPVRLGPVWTTDSPYRETNGQVHKWGREGVLAVEMQAASLYAFAEVRKAEVALIARVSNAIDHEGSQFDTGTNAQGLAILNAVARAARPFIA